MTCSMISRHLILLFYGTFFTGLLFCFAHAVAKTQCSVAQECSSLASVCSKFSLTYHCVDSQCCCLSYVQRGCFNPYTDLNYLLHNHHTGCHSIDECSFLSDVCRNVSLKSHCYDEKCCCFSFDQGRCVDPQSVLKSTTFMSTLGTQGKTTITRTSEHHQSSIVVSSVTPKNTLNISTRTQSSNASVMSLTPSISSTTKFTTLLTNSKPITQSIQTTMSLSSSVISTSGTTSKSITGNGGKYSTTKTIKTTVKPTFLSSQLSTISRPLSTDTLSLNTHFITIPMMTTKEVSTLPSSRTSIRSTVKPINQQLSLSQKSAPCKTDSDCNRDNTWVKLLFGDIKCTKSGATTECIHGRCYCNLNPSTVAPTQGSHSCYQCGDKSTQSPCSRGSVLYGKTSPCKAGSFCQTDISTDNNNVAIYKRCVDEKTCLIDWLLNTSDKEYCVKYGSVAGPDKFICSFCCIGRDCNAGSIPPKNTLYGSNPI